MAELPSPPEGIVLTHFSSQDDVERSRRFYTEVLGGRVPFRRSSMLPLANSWIVINAAEDRPTTSLRSSWRRRVIRPGQQLPYIRVKDIEAVYANGAPGVLNS